MRIVLKAVILFSLFVLSLNSWAENNKSYQIQVAVTSQDETEQILAFRSGFNRLLKRLTGKGLEKKEKNSAILATINQYRYIEQDDKPLEIAIEFNKSAVDNYIADKNLTKWQERLPNLIVWFALMTDDKQEILGTENSNAILEALVNTGHEAGLSLIIPEMDLDDIAKLSFNQVWKNKQKALTEASERYNPEGILTIKLMQSGKDKWTSLWKVQIGQSEHEFKFNDTNALAVLKRGTESLKKTLASPAVKTESIVFLQIEDIKSADAYNYYLHYLEGLTGVTQVQLDRVTPDSVLYKLNVNISKEALLKHIGSKEGLQLTDSQDDKVLHYRLVS